MFIREVKKRIRTDEKIYDYIQHRLVESVRTSSGPRQRTVLNLGTLEIDKDKYKDLANTIEAILNKDNQGDLFDADPEVVGLARHFAEIIIRQRIQAEPPKQEDEIETDSPRYESVDVNSITASLGRSVSLEHIALTQLGQLGFFDVLKECGFTESQQQHAAAQVCSRLVHPDSERETARWLRETSAMDELMGADFSSISDHALHRSADQLFAKRDIIEKRLSKKFRSENKIDYIDYFHLIRQQVHKRNATLNVSRASKTRRFYPHFLTLFNEHSMIDIMFAALRGCY
jgi:hypothetical protein